MDYFMFKNLIQNREKIKNQSQNQKQNQNQKENQPQEQKEQSQMLEKKVREQQPNITFWTIDELQQEMPHVQQLKEVFNLFLPRPESNSIDTSQVAECLRAMGLHFPESTFQTCFTQHLANFPQKTPPTRVSFELVLSIYCELAAEPDTPSISVMINDLRSCDTEGTNLLPYNHLKRMLTSMGEPLNEGEVSDLLDSLKDPKGNVNYVTLMQTMFSGDFSTADKLKEVRFYLDALGKNACFMDMKKRDEFIRAMRSLDTTKSGYVASNRLLNLLNFSEDRLTAHELVTLTRGMTKNKNLVDYRSFLRLIMND